MINKVMIMASEISKMIMETMLTLITTAFAFVAGLAWNEAIQKLIEEFYTAGGAVTGLLIYAVIVTIVAVVVTVLLARIAGKMGIDLDKD
jgi:C4-dicarboxylate transporter